MLGRTNNQRYLLWLALGTASMALAMASLLVFELAQKRAIDQGSAIRSDSLTALAFQFEREFLRLRQTLVETLASKENAADLDALTLRYDIFQSRLTLLRESPSVSLLTSRDEYKKVVPRLEHLVTEMDKTLAVDPLDRKVLAHTLADLNDLGAAVQALTLVADSSVSRVLEHQADTMRQQNELIVWLTLAQLVLLLVASGTLVVRQRRLEAERRALEQLTDELRKAHFHAEAANRSKSQFLANMSHELRTPFNGLMGMLGLLQTTPVSPQQADYIQTAQESATHLLTLLNDILDMSALETGKMTLKPAPFEIPRLLSEVSALMLPLAKSKGLDFQIQAPDGAFPVVLADETRVKQILFNLINNAIKFTSAGSVHMCVIERSRSLEMLEIAFEIQDSGIGIEPDALKRLFQRFYQVEETSTRRYGGTGLGLEISQSLARMMNGQISVQSVVGVGSTFTLSLDLPISSVAAEPSAPTPSLCMLVSQATPIPPSLQLGDAPEPSAMAMRILVVEDHPINQKLVGVLLGRMGCSISYCENGQLALDLVQQEVFDLILMDVNMPVMDGLAATRLIRALPNVVAHTPIVVLTADVMNEAREKAMKAGANDFVSKPVKLEQLRAIIQKYAGDKVVK
jgi:signal transduction histidine kinase/ActR/RegA family two-component response regulator